MSYTRLANIGDQQPGARQFKCLPGIYPGFTCGLQSSGSLEATLNAWDAFTGGYTEAVAFGLPNQMGTPNLAPLAGITRFVVFNVPMVPHAVHGGDVIGSLTALLRGDYDALIDATAAAVVALGLGTKQAVRIGEEYNDGSSAATTGSFEWRTGFRDLISGSINGISQYKLAAAYVEGRWRAQGYIGYAAWSGGNHDTSAIPIATAIPTHGDPNLTVWDWDLYPGPPFNGDKNTPSQAFARLDPIYAGYLAYCRANGILMAHSEIGQIYSPKSDQRYNDNGLIYPWLYNKGATNADTVAWMIPYFQQQPYVAPGGTPAVLDESHAFAFSVPTSGGAPGGSAATSPWTANFPPGTSGPNVNGTANTAANTGTLFNSSDSGLHWVWSPDPTVTQKRISWQASFGGVGSANGLGAEGMHGVSLPPVIPTTPAPPVIPARHIRRQYQLYA